jgi:hypothetical protein
VWRDYSSSVHIVPDTNALFGDAPMVRATSKNVLNLLDAAQAVLVFSPIVLEELKRRRSDDVRDLARGIQTQAKKLGSRAGTDTAAVAFEIDKIAAQAQTRYQDRLNEILAMPGVVLGSWPSATAQEMVQRELARKRPFLDMEKGTIGHRDTAIWLGVVELAKHHVGEQIVLVTADKGFLQGGHLHPDLESDLEEAGLTKSSVRVLNSLAAVEQLLEDAATEIEVEALEWRNARIVEKLYDFLRDLDSAVLAPGWDPYSGGRSEPEFDIGLSFAVDEWSTENVDGPTELEIEAIPPASPSLLTCSFVAEFQFSGFMDKFEWFSNEPAGVDLWDGDWNDHYVAVEASRSLKFVVSVEVDEEAETIDVNEIVSVEVDSSH